MVGKLEVRKMMRGSTDAEFEYHGINNRAFQTEVTRGARQGNPRDKVHSFQNGVLNYEYRGHPYKIRATF